MRTRATVALVAVVLALGACADPADPNENEHARTCADAGHTIKEHSQFGGKYSTTTYWCVDSDGRITDLWFGDDS